MRPFSGACVKKPDLSSGFSFCSCGFDDSQRAQPCSLARSKTKSHQSCPIRLGPFRVDVKISVIIPAYNEEKLLAKCIRSIHSALAANVRPGLETEVIVANNNSTD